MNTKIKTLAIILLASCNTVFTQHFEEIQKIVAPDREQYDRLGKAVCISENYLVLGSLSDDENEVEEDSLIDAGSAYIYELNEAGSWTFAQKITASLREEEANFGRAVSVEGNYLVVGVPRQSAAYIFERDQDEIWNEVHKITYSDVPYTSIGRSVAVSGNVIAIGARNYVVICERVADGTWSIIQNIDVDIANRSKYYAEALDLSGTKLIVGAYDLELDNNDENAIEEAGAAYIYERNEEGDFEFTQRIIAPEREADDRYGYSVAIYENIAIVGAYQENEDSQELNTLENAGSVYFYERNEEGNWNFIQKAVSEDRASEDYFGTSVSLFNNYAVVGASYEDEDNLDDNFLTLAGAAYIFKQNEMGTWDQTQKVTASDRAEVDLYGASVSIFNDQVVIGAFGHDVNEDGQGPISDVGSAYVLKLPCTVSSITDSKNIIENGDFGACTLDPWWFEVDETKGASANIALSDGESVICNIHTTGVNRNIHLQFGQQFTQQQTSRVKLNNRYSLSFNASAATDNRLCRIYLGQQSSPWDGYITKEQITLNKASQKFTYEFTATELFPDLTFLFQLGDENSAVAIDNVRLVDITGLGINSSNANPSIRIFPNPATSMLYIETPHGSELKLYNNVGMLQYQTLTKNELAQINISNMPAGIYVLAVKHMGISSFHKVFIK